jgi:hypothetical protein
MPHSQRGQALAEFCVVSGVMVSLFYRRPPHATHLCYARDETIPSGA